jgi:hypothetical protein
MKKYGRGSKKSGLRKEYYTRICMKGPSPATAAGLRTEVSIALKLKNGITFVEGWNHSNFQLTSNPA